LDFAINWQNIRMKYLFIITCFTLFACASSQKAERQQLNGSWELVAFPGTDKSFEETFSTYRPTLQFSDTSERVTGTTGCNHLSGSYRLEKESFQFGNNMITTKMACPGYNENIFLNAVQKINRYEMKEDQLRFYSDSNLVMAFAKKM
jgi:heat shock protein HslJ